MDIKMRFSELPIGSMFEYEVNGEPGRRGLLMKVGFHMPSPFPRRIAVHLNGILMGGLIHVNPEEVVVLHPYERRESDESR